MSYPTVSLTETELTIHSFLYFSLIPWGALFIADSLGDPNTKQYIYSHHNPITQGFLFHFPLTFATNGNRITRSLSISIIFKILLAAPEGWFVPASHASTVLSDTPI